MTRAGQPYCVPPQTRHQQPPIAAIAARVVMAEARKSVRLLSMGNTSGNRSVGLRVCYIGFAIHLL
jgi:hypothetical protein